MVSVFAIPDQQVYLSLLAAFLVSFGLGLLLIRFRKHIERFSRARNDHAAVQASHTGDPLRLGGVAVTAGLVFGAWLLSGRSSGAYTLFLLATVVPVFAAGLWEDLGHGVSPAGRFLAAVFAASMAVALLGLWVTRGDAWGLDGIMGFAPAAVFFTIVLAALFCHAVNLIDGMNGLAATVVIFSALGIAYVAGEAGLTQISVLALLLASAAFGFQLLNWPSAKLFLGDAGAYGLGHILVWLGISVIALAPDVAVPAVILLLFYPFADTFHTVTRRALEHKKITEPDRMHLHQKIRRGLEIVWIGRGRREVSNPLTTVVMLPITAGPVLTGVLVWHQPALAWAALLAFVGLFAGLHLAITALAKRYRKPIQMAGELPGMAGFGGLDSSNPAVEVSRYSGPFIQDSLAVQVIISRSSKTAPWRLMTEADNAQDQVWSEEFDTDGAAWAFFLAQVEQRGVAAMMGSRLRSEPGRRHHHGFVESSA